ncbi:MAG: substrate-binding domain-containing protein [Alphaproteobacteria bacterium]|nr:substrate-binding domain-containing protein [Alphaproteobacteria bacterium]MBU1573483.1 substrate-binding domain-containing protein [Alphaproteobacteria bacterium]MBU2079672.1 substrate-binding domain-containing protein [Alphaproteobacteria bacterium]MBU2162446.1 substrate-binding domain-containing protein [Alphaproteobacteria bacterium]MBU2245002.1 substrate-binding domain-containing protein [Alphaproteobacteria bacterium]
MNLKQLSELLGLSQTTVSRALNGYPEVSEKTRKKVEAAAKQHNYTPNTRARGLATGRNHAVGHVIPLSTEHEVVNPVFTDFIAGASEVYSRENYDMHLTVVPDASESDAYRKIAAKGSVDGVIVHGPKENDPRIKLLREIGMPFVVHGRSGSTDEQEYSWVDMNNTRAFERATQFLLDLGHRRIGLLNGLETMDFAAKRRIGYRTALEQAGVPEDNALCYSSEMTEEYGFSATTKMLALEQPPTALLASSIIVGFGVRRALDAADLKIGKDVSLIIHDDDLSYLRNGNSEPIYTATRSSVRQAGRICAEILMDMIVNPTRPAQHVLLDAELIIGHTTGPAPQG